MVEKQALKHWKIASLIATGIAALSITAVVLFYSIPNPCSIFPSQTSSDLVAPASPNELYDSSELVVIGRITDSTAKCEGSQIWTHMQITVEDSAKNPQNIKTLTGKAFGGKIGNYAYWAEDSQIFQKGDRAFLYLYKDNPSDTVYRISPYSGALPVNDLPDGAISAKEILKSFRLQSVTTSNSSTIDIPQGSNQETTLTLESFFGYDSPTNVTMTSFTYYNDTVNDDNGTLTTENANVSALTAFGLSLEPTYNVVQPVVNGSTQAQLTITASSEAVLGIYDILFSASPDDPYSFLAGGAGQTLLRINVTDNAPPIQKSTTPPTGISVNIEKYGRREFYQDENAGLPTNLTISDASVFGKDAMISWPSIGPNYVITKASFTSGGDEVVFDYYKSLGIDENMFRLSYDESAKARDLQPPPAVFGRYFGFDWNQTNLDGARVEPGTYQVILTMPVMMEDQGQKRIITLTSGPDSLTIIEGKPVSQAHNLSLEYNVNDTDLLTGEPYSFSLYLVNNGNQTESFTLDHNSEEGSCYWKHTFKLEHPDHILPPGDRVDLAGDDNVGGAPTIPGLYPYTPFVMLSIDEPARVECLNVKANTVTLNVTAPVYEGVELVITTDKQIYERNETVAMALYIENNSDKPFKLQEVSPSIIIRDDYGIEVYGMSWIADYSVYPTIEPHSRYSLTSTIPLNWDQTVYLEDSSSKPAEPGEYSILATFTYPYLKSEQLTILIED